MDINSYLGAVVSGIAIIQGINTWRATIAEKRKQEIEKKLGQVLDTFNREVELIRATTVSVHTCNTRHTEILEEFARLRSSLGEIKGAQISR